ncbi:hypothetical protein GCM10017779_12480 [Streptomyces capillispiralis]|uniref:Uncharacterized protein n=1 Tax=Streptomyces capillispiralis TaxID=68182 RepID=A0A561TI92_9ACTN|nr:hypothetical protein FHX78_113792 [Streptomyces capillispiralis]GHH90791.1 hypothetical protein GCM10017779_12480 [Streptomyces capillispiralis]
MRIRATVAAVSGALALTALAVPAAQADAITSNSTGNLSTTVTATVDGYYRYSFAGTSTTPAVNAAGDFVDVQ